MDGIGPSVNLITGINQSGESSVDDKNANEDMGATGLSADIVYRISHSDNCPAYGRNANEDNISSQCGKLQANNNKENVNSKQDQPGDVPANGQDGKYYVAEVIHSFDAQANGELNLSVGDYVVVRHVHLSRHILYSSKLIHQVNIVVCVHLDFKVHAMF